MARNTAQVTGSVTMACSSIEAASVVCNTANTLIWPTRRTKSGVSRHPAVKARA
jgi:hypothetical protein